MNLIQVDILKLKLKRHGGHAIQLSININYLIPTLLLKVVVLVFFYLLVMISLTNAIIEFSIVLQIVLGTFLGFFSSLCQVFFCTAVSSRPIIVSLAIRNFFIFVRQ